MEITLIQKEGQRQPDWNIRASHHEVGLLVAMAIAGSIGQRTSDLCFASLVTLAGLLDIPKKEDRSKVYDILNDQPDQRQVLEELLEARVAQKL